MLTYEEQRIQNENDYRFNNRKGKINREGDLIGAFIKSAAGENTTVTCTPISGKQLHFSILISEGNKPQKVEVLIQAWGEVSVKTKSGKTATTDYEFEIDGHTDGERIRNDIVYRLAVKANQSFLQVGVNLEEALKASLARGTPQSMPRKGLS